MTTIKTMTTMTTMTITTTTGSDYYETILCRKRLQSYIMVKKKQDIGYERSSDPAGSFSAIPMNVIENSGFSSVPRMYST